MKHRIIGPALLLLLCSCASTAEAYGFVSYRASFGAATAGNMLNLDIYHPEKGPEGFINYLGYFAQKPTLVLNRDLTFKLNYQIKNKESVSYAGTYYSSAINSGAFELKNRDGELITTLSWVTYYQMKYETMMDIDELGGDTKVVCLMHSADIFR